MPKKKAKSKPETLDAPSTFGGRRPSSGSEFEWVWSQGGGECMTEHAELEIWNSNRTVYSWSVSDFDENNSVPEKITAWGISVFDTKRDKFVFDSSRTKVWFPSKDLAVETAQIMSFACIPNDQAQTTPPAGAGVESEKRNES